MKSFGKVLGLVAAVLLALWTAGPVSAAPLTLTLSPTPGSLQNVNDAAGLWQFDGGTVTNNGAFFGHYATVRRVVFGGTDTINSASVTVTIFAAGADPAESMTLQGVHSYNTGKMSGSVSAATAAFKKHIRKPFTGDLSTGVLTIQ